MSAARGISGTPARAWTTAALTGAVAMSLVGLTSLVDSGPWIWTALTILAATSAVTILARIVSRRPFLPSLAGALAGAWLLLVAYVPAPDGGRTWWPSPTALRGVGTTISAAVEYAFATAAPAPMTAELAAMLATLGVALFLIADVLAAGAGLAATAGVVVLAPWLTPALLDRDVSPAPLIACLGLWLSTVALMRRSSTTRWRARDRDSSAPATVIAAAAVGSVTLALALTPLVSALPVWGRLPSATTLANWGGTQRLDLEIDLRDSLRTQSSAPVLSYTSAGGRVDVLRAYSLASFDGARWERDRPGDTVPPTGTLWPTPFDGWEEDGSRGLTVRVGDSAESQVPIPDAPRAVSAGDGWRYSPETDELLLPEGSTTAGLVYTVRFATTFHDPAALRGAEEAIAAGGDDAVDGRYLELPRALDQERVRDLAATVAASAQDRYGVGLALQEYLRGGTFVYDTEVTPSGRDAVSTFLDERRGYCVQFATAMVVMARALDIPARMAIGFLGGSNQGTGDFTVTGRDAHAWPELYFPGHGWVRFEPTPAVQTGARPAYAIPDAAPAPVPDVRDSIRPTAAPAGPTAAPAPTASGVTAPTASTAPAWGWALGALALALVLTAGGIAVARSARPVRAVDPERAWARALAAAGGERHRWTALTPAECRDLLALEDWDLAARDAWAALAAAVEQHRYAPRGSHATPEELERWTNEIRAHARKVPQSPGR